MQRLLRVSIFLQKAESDNYFLLRNFKNLKEFENISVIAAFIFFDRGLE